MLLTVVKGEANGVIAMWRGLEVDRIDVKFILFCSQRLNWREV